jgi:hypothetical protein
MLRICDSSSEVGGDVRAALDQGGIRGANLHGQAPKVVARSPLVRRSEAGVPSPLAATEVRDQNLPRSPTNTMTVLNSP